MKKVSIIVPSRQLKRDKNLKHFYKPITSLPELLKSLTQQSFLDYEVIVVINGQQDKELEEFVRQNGQLKFCLNSVNAGVSRAWNMGRQLAEAPYLLYVNDDVTLFGESIKAMVTLLEQDKHVAMVGPKGAIWNNGEHVRFVGEKVPEDADAIAGFCFMVRAEVFDKIGGFDLNYSPAGMEEIDFCHALRSCGHTLRVLPGLDIKTEPSHGISARKEVIKYLTTEIDTKELDERNKAYFKKKWGIQ